jgi:glucose-1-phosphate thymidylyltransferase
MKGIILAGGSGTRLYPATLAINKQLLPVYDKPMVYYPLSVLMLAGIRDILLISTRDHLPFYRNLLGDGSTWGISLTYIVQDQPLGLAHAFILGQEFVGSDRVALILGDNLFYGHGLSDQLECAAEREVGATVFAYYVSEPSQYGVVRFDEAETPVELVEKPSHFVSNWAVTGLYFYDNAVLDIAAELQPSARGELEITDVNRRYLELGRLSVEKLGRGYAWLDTGSHDTLLEAAEFVRSIQHRQGLLVGCPEEVAYGKGFITAARLRGLASKCGKTAYGRYLQRLSDEPPARKIVRAPALQPNDGAGLHLQEPARNGIHSQRQIGTEQSGESNVDARYRRSRAAQS